MERVVDAPQKEAKSPRFIRRSLAALALTGILTGVGYYIDYEVSRITSSQKEGAGEVKTQSENVQASLATTNTAIDDAKTKFEVCLLLANKLGINSDNKQQNGGNQPSASEATSSTTSTTVVTPAGGPEIVAGPPVTTVPSTTTQP